MGRGKLGEANWVVGGKLSQGGGGGIWKLGVSIINPPPPKSTTKKIPHVQQKGWGEWRLW